MPKRNNIVYTESIGKKGEYKIFSVKTKELLGTIKGNNIKMYWEAFDTDNKFLMSGSRKKECMDYFREMDTKRLMAKGGGIGFEKLSKQVAKEYEGDKVAPKYQHEYGKTYSKAEAKEVGDKVAGKVYWQQQGRKMEDGGNMDNLDARISKAIYKAYGNIDDALEFKQYNTGNGISPYRLVFLAVIKGFITPEEINKDLLNSAYETSSETEDDDEIGSSDTNNYVWSMLRDAGFDMEVENGKYVRVGNKMENGGNTDKMNEYIRKKREDQEKEEEGKDFAPFRAFVYSGSDQFADFKTDDFHKAVKWAKETLEQQRVYRKSSENLWAIVDEFTPIEKRNNVIYAYSEVARFGEEDMKDMKFKNGGSMSSGSNGFYIVLADGSKKEYAVNSITEVPNIYFAMGTNGIDKGTPMVHHDNVLTSVFYANGTPVEAMPQYAGKDYYDLKKKMADGGNVAEDEDYYRVFRNNAGKDIAVKIVKNPIFGKFDYYVDGTLRGQFDSFAQARQEVNYENFDMYKDGGNLHSSEFYAKGGGVGNEKKKDIISFDYETRTFQGDKELLEDIIRKIFNIERRFSPVLNFDKSAMEFEFTEYVSEDEIKSEKYKADLFKKVQAVKSKIEGLYNLSVNYYTNLAESWNNFENSIVITIGQKKNYDEGSTFFAKGGVVVTSIKDIPNFKEENEAGRITYRGLGMGKLSDDFYKVAGEGGTRIKVNGKEYNITMTEFNTFGRDSSGKMRIKFAAPLRKFADGGNLHSSEFYEDGGEIVDYQKKSNIFIARYNGKEIELEARSMFDAEKKAIEQLKVPKSKIGLLSIMNKQAYEKGDFQFN